MEVAEQRRLSNVYVTCLLSAQIINECMDELKETDAYKGKLKVASKQFSIQIAQSFIKKIDDLFDAGDMTSMAIQEGIEECAKMIATLSPDKIAEIKEIIKDLKDND